MDISKVSLEELLLIIEIKKLKPLMTQNFKNMWTEEQIYEKIHEFYSTEEKTPAIQKQDKDTLYQWLKEKRRYSLLEILIKMLLDKLLHPQLLNGTFFNVVDPFILNNLDSLIQILMEFATTYIPNKDFHVVPKTPLTKKNLHALLKDILKEIDPTLQWLSLYEQMNISNRIIYVDELNEKEKEKIGKELLSFGNTCILKEDKPYILFRRNGTIEDVPNLLHEFTHYIIYSKGHPSRTLAEFPSLFFENYVFKFLEKKGYSNREIQFLREARLESVISLAPYVFIICHYGAMLLTHHEITEKLDMEAQENGLLALPKHMETLIQGYSFPSHDLKTSSNARCDNCIAQLILHDNRFFKSYPYLVGFFLAHKMAKINSNSLSQMKDITENLYSIDPIEIFKIIGYPVEDIAKKQKKKYLI